MRRLRTDKSQAMLEKWGVVREGGGDPAVTRGGAAASESKYRPEGDGGPASPNLRTTGGSTPQEVQRRVYGGSASQPAKAFRWVKLMTPMVVAIVWSIALVFARGSLIKMYNPGYLAAALTGPIIGMVGDVAATNGSGSGDQLASEAEPAATPESGVHSQTPGSLYYVEQFNDPVAAFLSMSALVYALIYAYSYQVANEKLARLSRTVAEEASAMMRLVLVLRSLPWRDDDALEDALAVVLKYSNRVVDELGGAATWQGIGPLEELYSVVFLVRSIGKPESGLASIGERGPAAAAAPGASAASGSRFDTITDRQVAGHVIDLIDTLARSRNERTVLSRQDIPWVIWAYLMALSVMVFFGVLMLQSGSASMDFTLCMAAVTSIAMSLLVLTDANYPFWGCLQADMTSLVASQVDLEALLVAHIDRAQPLCLSARVDRIPSFRDGASAAQQAKSMFAGGAPGIPGAVTATSSATVEEHRDSDGTDKAYGPSRASDARQRVVPMGYG